MDLERLKAFVNDPPVNAKVVTELYRAAIKERVELQAHLNKLASETNDTRANLVRKLGVEEGLQRAVEAMMDATAAVVIEAPPCLDFVNYPETGESSDRHPADP